MDDVELLRAQLFSELIEIQKKIAEMSVTEPALIPGSSMICEETEGFEGEIVHVLRDGLVFFNPMDIWLLRNGNNTPMGMIGINPEAVKGYVPVAESGELKSHIKETDLILRGFIHDFGNQLMAISGFLDLAKNNNINSEKVLNYMRIMEKVVKHSCDMLAQFKLLFCDGKKSLKETINISELVKNVASVAIVGSKVDCMFYFPENLCKVEINYAQICRVFTNLIINASQAMPNGGTITVRAENVEIEKGQIPMLMPGRYVKIILQDGGTGIENEYLNRIFEPYFTTKANGTGLGLAIVNYIIKGHGGYVAVESEKGAGTTFYVYLPVSQNEVKEDMPEALAAAG